MNPPLGTAEKIPSFDTFVSVDAIRVSDKPHIALRSPKRLLWGERIKRKNYANREKAGRDVVIYIKTFYESMQGHRHANNLSPVEYEKQYLMRRGSV